MKFKNMLLSIVAIAIASLRPLPAQNNVDRTVLNSALQRLATFEYGQDKEILDVVDHAVIASYDDPDLKASLEDKFTSILRSDADNASKKYICRKLMHMGTTKSVPILTQMLNDPGLAHMARFALEQMPYPAVDQVLLRALDATRGSQKIGIIESLGNRRVRRATDVLVSLSRHDSAETAQAAAMALGKIGNARAIQALFSARADASAALALVIDDGLLAAAESMSENGSASKAVGIYEELYKNGTHSQTRLGGFRGLMLLEPAKATDHLLDALASDNPETRGLAARLLAERKVEAQLQKVLEAMPSLPIAGQSALIHSLAQRGDVAARPAVRAAVDHNSQDVRVAASEALAVVGDSSDVKVLAEIAAGQPPENGIARRSLVALPGDDVDTELTAYLKQARPTVKVELINALVARQATAASAIIGEYLDDSDQAVRLASLKALGELGDEEEIEPITDFLNDCDNAQERSSALAALKSICGRLGEDSAGPVLSALDSANVHNRMDLIGILPIVGGEAALQTARAAAKDQDANIRDAGIRTLAKWPDHGALKDLERIASDADQLSHRVLAFRGYIRLLKVSSVADADKIRRLRDAVRRAERREEKVMALSGFSQMKTLEALKRMEHFIYDKEISEEACSVVVQICSKLSAEEKTDIAVALIQVLRITKKDRTIADARGIMRKLNIRPEFYLGTERRPDPQTKKIVFVAGPMDHAGPGAHEYPKDLILLKKCIDTSLNIDDVSTEIYFGKVPGIEVLQNTAALVVHSSADRAKGEVHALFPSLDESYGEQERQFYGKLDSLFKKGLGLVVLHYAVWTDKPESREYMLDWIGGYHEKGKSRVKVVTAQVRPATPAHPILNGVGPWTTEEEYYFNQRLRRDDRFVPILHSPSLNDSTKQDVIAWAVEREGGGRGFGFTGCHYHHHLVELEDYRQAVLNAIIWTAGIEIPNHGVNSEVPAGWD